jgi:hypothetical protein
MLGAATCVLCCTLPSKITANNAFLNFQAMNMQLFTSFMAIAMVTQCCCSRISMMMILGEESSIKITSVILMKCSVSTTLREEHRLRVFENREESGAAD